VGLVIALVLPANPLPGAAADVAPAAAAAGVLDTAA
jgi:hypothetical protein